MPTKAETQLSEEEIREICARLFRTPGGRTLRIIHRVLAEHGVAVSPTSGATSFRDGPLASYLAELKAKSDRAQQVAAYAKEGLSMSDAANVRLAETVFDELMQPSAAALTPKERDTYSRIIARARAGDQRAAYLETKLAEMQQGMQLREFDAVAAAIKHAKEIRAVLADKTLGDGQKTARVRKILFGERPADFKPVTTTGAAYGEAKEGA